MLRNVGSSSKAKLKTEGEADGMPTSEDGSARRPRHRCDGTSADHLAFEEKPRKSHLCFALLSFLSRLFYVSKFRILRAGIRKKLHLLLRLF